MREGSLKEGQIISLQSQDAVVMALSKFGEYGISAVALSPCDIRITRVPKYEIEIEEAMELPELWENEPDGCKIDVTMTHGQLKRIVEYLSCSCSAAGETAEAAGEGA